MYARSVRSTEDRISVISARTAENGGAIKEHSQRGGDGGDHGSMIPGDNMPRLWQEGDPYKFAPRRRGDPWEESMKRVDRYDDEMCRAWKEDVDTLLVFAGLFSAALTAFIIESYQWLQTDPTAELLRQIAIQVNPHVIPPEPGSPVPLPSASSIRINTVWFLSLILSLSTVLLGILCKQWLREHRRDTPLSSSKEALELRQLRFESLERWGIPVLLASLPLILQIALVLFLYGVLDLLWSLNVIVAAFSTAATAIGVSMLCFTTILPAYYLLRFPSMVFNDEVHLCPYKSPQAWLFYKLTTFFFPGAREGEHHFRDWASSDLHLLRNHTPTRIHNGYLLRSLRWMIKTFCDSTVMANHMFHCFQNLDVDVAAFATGQPEERSPDAIYYDLFRHSSWDLDIGKFIAELCLRQLNSSSRDHRGIGDALRSFWHLTVVDFIGDGQAPHLHLEFLLQVIASIRCYCADNRITLLDMNPLMIVCKELWRHPDSAIREQSILIVDDFEAWISRTGEELQREFIPSFVSSIADIIYSQDDRAIPISALIASDKGRGFIRFLDHHLASKDIDMEKYSLQDMPMSWQDGKLKVIRLSGLPLDYFDTLQGQNYAGGYLRTSDIVAI